jgi:Uma2 family endonuclease
MPAVKRWSGPRRGDWTVRTYYRLNDLQAFRDQRVELLDGMILEKEPETPAHAASRHMTRDVLAHAFGPGYWIRLLAPLRLSRRCELGPDLAVVPGGPRGDMPTPTTALLVVEVSDETLSYDRRRKGSLYARAGIADYWIVNLNRGQLEVYRQPTPVPTCRYGFGYSVREILGPDDSASPLAAPQGRVKVADLLP